MIQQQTQVVDLDMIIAAFIQTMQLPETIQVVDHSYLLDPVQKKVVLTITVNNTEDLVNAKRAEEELAELKRKLDSESKAVVPLKKS